MSTHCKEAVDPSIDRFRCCLPCAHKLLKAVKVIKDQNAPPPARKGDAAVQAKAASKLEAALNDPAHPILGGLGTKAATLK